MLITTTGRTTGKPRQAMVDVMNYDNTSDTYYIEAAHGTNVDWYKNIQRNPAFEAQAGHRKFKAHVDSLSNEGALEMLVEFYPPKTRIYTICHGDGWSEIQG